MLDLSTGHSLSRRLETDSGFQRQGGDQGFGTEDQLLMHREVDQRLNALQQKQNQLRMYLAERDRELGVHMQLGDMESGIKKVLYYDCALLSLSCKVLSCPVLVSVGIPLFFPIL